MQGSINVTDRPQGASAPASPGAGALPVLKVFMPPSIMGPLAEALFSGYIGEGPRVQAFEEQLGAWLGNPNVVALNSGSAALQLAVRLAGAGPGDEIISTPMTCIATNQAIVLQGARILWADIDPETGNLDPADIARKINARTRAIMVMHWGGAPCDMREIQALADAHGLAVIEDACHALGARYGGRMIGAHSDFVCLSFQAVKVMSTGDGGALLCKRPADAERARLLRWYGMDRRLNSYLKREKQFFEQDIREVGYKTHMNDLAATLGLEQLKYVRGNIGKHQAHAARYNQAFARLRHVRPLRQDPNRVSNHWLYTLRVQDPAAFTRAMQAEGIDASPIHVRNDRYAIFKDFQAPLPGVDVFDAEHICIPVGWWLEEADVQRVIQAVWKYDAGLA